MAEPAHKLTWSKWLRKLIVESLGGSITAAQATQNMLRVRELAIDAGATYSRSERLLGGNQLDVNSGKWARDTGRLLEKKSPIAQGIMSAMEMYTLGDKGLTLSFTGEKEAVKVAERYLNKWTERVDIDWLNRVRELYRRSIRDGEAIPRFFDNWALRWMEPEYLTPYDASLEWTFGLKHVTGDTETITAAYLQYGTDSEIVDAADFVLLKRNVDRCIKRGLSDFLSLGEYIIGAQNLMLTMGEVEPLRQQYIALFMERSATAPDVNALIAAQTNYTNQYGDPVRRDTGGAKELHLTGDQTVQGMPAPGNMEGALKVCDGLLLMAGQRYKMSLDLISGAQDRNNAIDISTESKFAKYITGIEQPKLVAHVRTLLWRLMELSEDEGDLPQGLCDNVCLQVKPQQTFGGDPNKQTERYRTLNEAGVLSDEDWSVKEGLDPAKVEANKKAKRALAAHNKGNPPDEEVSLERPGRNGYVAAQG